TQSRHQFAFDADRADLAPRILEGRSRVAGQLRDVEELRIEGCAARADRDIARGQTVLGGLRVEDHRRAGQAHWKARLARRRLICEDSLWSAKLELRVDARAELRVVEAVPAANDRARSAA